MQTDCPVRIFEILSAFVASERAKRNFGDSPIKGESLNEVSYPSEQAKARLINAIHTVEDIFTSYARDTISHVIEDLKN